MNMTNVLSAKGTSKRNNGLDLLRLLSCIAVIVLHVNWIYFSDIAYSPSTSVDYIVGAFVNIITRFCVPCFVMISGAFLLSNEKNSDFFYFYKRTFFKTIVPFLLVLSVYFAKSFLSNLMHSPERIVDSFASLLNTGFVLWYMYMLAGLYILTPFLIRLKKSLTAKQWTCSGCVLMCWACFSQTTSMQIAAGSIGVVFAYLSFYIVGNILYERACAVNSKDKKTFVKFCFLAIVLCVLLLLLRVFLNIGNDERWVENPYTNFFHPLILISSICVYWGFLHLNLSQNIEGIAKHTYLIYLTHAGVYPFVYRGIDQVMHNKWGFSAIVICLITFCVCIMISFIYYKAEGIIMKMMHKSSINKQK